MPDGKWFITNFVKFQKGVEIKALNPDNKAHLGVLRCLEKYNKTDFSNAEQGQLFVVKSKPHQSPNEAPSMGHQSPSGVEVKVKVEVYNNILCKYKMESITQEWVEWVTYRKEIRHKMTSSIAEKQIKFLAKQGVDNAKTIIEESIKNGWTGLFVLGSIKNTGKNNNIADKVKGTKKITPAAFDSGMNLLESNFRVNYDKNIRMVLWEWLNQLRWEITDDIFHKAIISLTEYKYAPKMNEIKTELLAYRE